eukprot:m.209470 g.209470  ORF g.209470 m.209470 type:complete len:262 (+) comp18984_c0_seq2:267-1052(+)
MSTDSDLPSGFHGDYGSDDEEPEARELPRIEYTKADVGSTKAKFLFIPVGDVPLHACKARIANIDKWEQYGTINFPAAPMASLPKQFASLIVSDSENLAVCSIPARLAPEDPVASTRELFKSISPQLAVIMHERPHFDFKGSSAHAREMDTPLVRFLHTSSYSRKTSDPPVLEAPSIVDGPAAAVLSYCQAHGIAAILVVSYRRSGGTMTNVDAASFSPFDAAIVSACDDSEINDTGITSDKLQSTVAAAWSRPRDHAMYL